MTSRPLGDSIKRPGVLWGVVFLATAGVVLGACASSGHTGAPSTTTTEAPVTTVQPATTVTTAPSTTTAPPATAPPATPPPTTAPPTTVAATSACTTSELTLSLGPPDGTAGSIHYAIVFHNASSSACDLYGYPGVSFLDASGHQIGDPAQREPNERVQTVRLPAGGNAYVDLAVTDPGIPPCSASATPSHVRIYPPGNTQATFIAAPSGMHVCASENTSSYTSAWVTPVSATEL